MSQQPQNAGQGQPQSSLTGGCDQCVQNCTAATRLLCFFTFVTWIIGILGMRYYTENCVYYVIYNYEVWRVVTGPLLGGQLDGLICALFFFFVVMRVEPQKGTVPTLYTAVVTTFLTQLFFFALVTLLLLFGVRFGSQWSCSYGMWPTVFALLVYETTATEEQTRRLLCFPCQVPTLYYPVILCVLFSIFNPRLDRFTGLLVGYVFISTPRLHLSIERARRWELNPLLSKLVQARNFISVNNLGSHVPWSPFTGQAVPSAAASGQTWGSGRVGGGNVSGLNAPAPEPAAPSVFTQPGHRLDQAEATTTVPTEARGRPGAVLADRLAQRMKQARKDQPTEAKETEAAAPIKVNLDHVDLGVRKKSQEEISIDVAPPAQEDNPFLRLQEPSSLSERSEADTPLSAPVESEHALAELMELGYTEEDAAHALEVSGGNLQDAATYLKS